jgi:hypothetical protein
MNEIAIYVEGGGDTADQKAELRQGLDRLLEEVKSKARAKRLGWKLVCAGGRQTAYEAFLNALRTTPVRASHVLLVDSESIGPQTVRRLAMRHNECAVAKETVGRSRRRSSPRCI